MEPELNYPALLRALVMAESSNNPNAVSKDGAVGLTQILPQYAHNLRRGVPSVYDVADTYGHPYGEMSDEEAARLLRIPEISLFLGDKFFQSLVQREGGNLDDAMRAYNMGADELDDWEASGKDISSLDKEAREYPLRIREYYTQYTGGGILPQAIAPVRENNIGYAVGSSPRPPARPAGLLPR